MTTTIEIADSAMSDFLERFTQVGDIWYCADDCSTCDHCGETELTNDTTYLNNLDATICSACTAHYSQCEDCEVWYCDDDGPSCDCGQSGIAGYHQRPRYADSATPENPWLFGVEIEKEDSDLRESLEDKYLRLADRWIAESDSSLDDETGVEIISPAYNFNQWDKFIADIYTDAMQEVCNADATWSCGGHISLSRYGSSSRQTKEYIRELLPVLMALYPKRLNSTYVRSNKHDNDPCCKYQPFFADSNRLELRIFPAVRNADCLVRRLNLIRWFTVDTTVRRDADIVEDSMRCGYLATLFSSVYNAEQWYAVLERYIDFRAWYFDPDAPPTELIKPFLNCYVS